MVSENLREKIEKQLNPLELKNIELVEFSKGSCTLEVEVSEEQLNYLGIVHGGIIFAICDSCAGVTADTLNEKSVTLQASINYVRSTSSGYIRAVSTTLHSGKSTSVVEVNAYNEEEILLANANFTMYNIQK